MLVLMYIVLAVALCVTAYSVWHGMRTRRKGDDIVNRVPAGRIGWCVLFGLLLCLVVTFLLGSSKPVMTNGQPFTSVFWLKATDPELNTTSTADISFMLLIFFLVTSSMDTDKGLLRQMAPPPMENSQPQDVNKDLVMRVELDANDQLTCDGKPATLQELSAAVVSMATVNRTEHIVAILADRETTYEAYFRMQDAIVAAYHQLREQYSQKRYGKAYRQLTSEERSFVNEYYPQRISESFQEKGGGQ